MKMKIPLTLSSVNENNIKENNEKKEMPNKIKNRSTIKNYFNRDIKYLIIASKTKCANCKC